MCSKLKLSKAISRKEKNFCLVIFKLHKYKKIQLGWSLRSIFLTNSFEGI